MGRDRHKVASRVVSISTRGVQDLVQETVTPRETPVMWGIPMDEVLFSKFFQGFFRNAYFMPWDGFAFTENTYLPKARNAIHNACLKNSKHPYLMMLDSDILFPPHALDKLLAHKLPVVAGWYRNKHVKMPDHPIVYDWVGKAEDGKNEWKHRLEPGMGLEKVDGVGMGCVLMSREVLEKLGTDPYDMNDGGEDLNICKKLMEAGIPLHVDWSVNCAHMGINWT